MTVLNCVKYKCDACGDTCEGPINGLPTGWASPSYMQRDGSNVTELHVCADCVVEAINEWLPHNTWWGSTENWR